MCKAIRLVIWLGSLCPEKMTNQSSQEPDSDGQLRERYGLCSRQLSPYSVLGPHMPATNASSRGDALATKRPQYCAQREYSVARAKAATRHSQCFEPICPLDQVFELQHFHLEYGILSPENHRQIRGEAA